MNAAHKPRLAFPPVRSGKWKADMIGGGSIQLGGAINLLPREHAIEFSWVVRPITVMPEKGSNSLPGILMIIAPVKRIIHIHPGLLIEGPIGVQLDLHVTRPQFSDLISILRSERQREICFTLNEKADNQWPVSSWSLNVQLPG